MTSRIVKLHPDLKDHPQYRELLQLRDLRDSDLRWEQQENVRLKRELAKFDIKVRSAVSST